MHFSPRGFTLFELMVVIGIIWLLGAALFPSFSNYIQRGRDSSRISDIDNLGKKLNLYFSENDTYPDADPAGCVNDAAIAPYSDNEAVADPLTSHYNGCNTLGKYGYASGRVLQNPNAFSILAIMEQPYGGNYAWPLSTGFTGTLTQLAYNTWTNSTLVKKWNGRFYIFMP